MDLAGDIGGTHTRLALFAPATPAPAALEIYSSRDHDGLEAMLRAFMAAHPATIERACFGVAGPVRNGHVKTTNLAWPVEAAGLAAVLGLERVGLVNDLVANAYGIAELGPEDVATLNEGDPAAGGNAAVVSAGTGLGEAGLFWDGTRHHVFASEGGHTDFGPRSDAETALRAHLAAQHAHVSYERVCSGMGLVAIYGLPAFGGEPEPDWLTAEMAQHDAGGVISKAGLEGRDPVCVQALEMMVSIYGAEAGNLTLKLLGDGRRVSRRRHRPADPAASCRTGHSWRRSPPRAGSPTCWSTSRCT